MDPSLIAYQNQINQQQQSLPQESSGEMTHPFQSGVQLAMQAARSSIGLPTRQQNNQSEISHGMMGLSQGLMNPNLNTYQALSGGLQAAHQHRSQQNQINMQTNAELYAHALKQKEREMMYQQKLEEAEAERQLKRELAEQQWSQRQDMQSERLEEQRRYHDMMNLNREALLDIRRYEKGIGNRSGEESEGLYGIPYVPLSSLNKKFADTFSKDATAKIKTLDTNKRAIESAKEMEDIFKKYPNIGSSFLNAVQTEGKEATGFWNTLLKNFAKNDPKFAAIEKLRKLSSDIRYDIVMNTPGAKGTDIVKNLIKEATTSGLNQDESAFFVLKKIVNNGKNNIKDIKIIEDAITKGMYPKIASYEETSMEEGNGVINNELSEEELRNIASQ